MMSHALSADISHSRHHAVRDLHSADLHTHAMLIRIVSYLLQLTKAFMIICPFVKYSPPFKIYTKPSAFTTLKQR